MFDALASGRQPAGSAGDLVGWPDGLVHPVRAIELSLGVVAISLGVVVLAIGLLGAPAAAGDSIAVFEVEPDEVDAAPGDVVTVDVVLASDGDYTGAGVVRYDFVLAVPPSIASVEAVDAGPFLEADGASVEHTASTVEPGAVHVEHERVGADDGVRGKAVAATVTLAVEDDAPPATATIDVAEPRSYVANSDFRLNSYGQTGRLHVDGGGTAYEPPYSTDDAAEAGESGGASSPGVTTAADANRTVERDAGGSGSGEESGTDESDGSAADAVPGFGVGVAILSATAAVLGLVGWRRR